MNRNDVYEIDDAPVGLTKEKTPEQNASDTKITNALITQFKAERMLRGEVTQRKLLLSQNGQQRAS